MVGGAFPARAIDRAAAAGRGIGPVVVWPVGRRADLGDAWGGPIVPYRADLDDALRGM
jgi:hypothetical protein